MSHWLEAFRAQLRTDTDPEEAERFIADCEASMVRLQAEWGLSDCAPANHGHCSLIYRAKDRSGREVAVKIPARGEELSSGRAAALAFSCRGGLEILADDFQTGALMMPWLGDAPDLSGFDETSAQEVALQARLRLPFGAVEGLTTLTVYFQDSKSAAAIGLVDHLVNTAHQDVLLHGDLHHFNLFLVDGEWLAIDAKGLWGDLAYEPAAFLRNAQPDEWSEAQRVDLLVNRIERFAQGLGVPADRVWAWAVADRLSEGSLDQADTMIAAGRPSWRDHWLGGLGILS